MTEYYVQTTEGRQTYDADEYQFSEQGVHLLNDREPTTGDVLVAFIPYDNLIAFETEKSPYYSEP